MREHALTVKAVHDGPVCALILNGDLDLNGTGGLLGPAALAIGNRTERLVLDLAGVTFLDCAGARALAAAASFAPSGCPVIIRSLSPAARRILELLDPGVANSRPAWPGPAPRPRSWAASHREPAPARPGAALPGGHAVAEPHVIF